MAMRAALVVLGLLLCACSSKSSHSKSSGGAAGTGGAGNSSGLGGTAGSAGAGGAGTGGASASGGTGGVACTPCAPDSKPTPSDIEALDMVMWTAANHLALTGTKKSGSPPGAVKLCAPSNLNCSGNPIDHAQPLSAATVFGADLFVAAKNRVIRIAANDTAVTQQIPSSGVVSFTIQDLTVDAEHVFVSAGLGITRLARSDGKEHLLNSTHAVQQLVAGGKRVYFTSDAAFGYFDKPPAGIPATVSMIELLDIKSDALAVVGENEAYFASAGVASADIYVSDGTLAGTNRLTATEVPPFPKLPVLYFSDKMLFAGAQDGSVFRVPATAAAIPTTLARLEGPILALAKEGNVLFALVGGTSKRIVSIGAPNSCCQ